MYSCHVSGLHLKQNGYLSFSFFRVYTCGASRSQYLSTVFEIINGLSFFSYKNRISCSCYISIFFADSTLKISFNLICSEATEYNT